MYQFVPRFFLLWDIPDLSLWKGELFFACR